jgi:selenide,water dikinase
VYAWESGPAIVQTVDFFTPIVDDPFIYGQIAAANAVSDIYAMGGRPLTALAIAGFPKKGLDSDTIGAVFQGGYEKLREAGVALLGGHTVQDEEIKFGYAVTGAIDPGRILTNASAKADDVLILTKPIGTGVIGTAIKFNRAPASVVDAAIASMRMLNKSAAETIGAEDGVHACTDITGFGLLGHGTEMAAASNVTLEIHAAAVPVFDGVLELVSGNRSGGMASNQEYFETGIEFDSRVADVYRDLLFDPQTSGGLLIAVAAAKADNLLQTLRTKGLLATNVGVVRPQANKRIHVRQE